MTEVLVVDDDPDIRMLVTFALEDSGFRVRQAADGNQALDALEASVPDAMVLDLMMPNVDGFGVLRGMRRLGIASETRVVVLTCKTEERDHLRGWELGAHEYMTKPFDPDELVACVQALLEATPDDLAQRRDSELQKAELLDRIEAAFVRPGQLSAKPGGRQDLL